MELIFFSRFALYAFLAVTVTEKRLFCIRSAKEEAGEVILWSKYTRTVNNKKETRYTMNVQTAGGNVYTIDTRSGKAKKYKDNTSAVIMIPPQPVSENGDNYPVIIKEDLDYYHATAIFSFILGVIIVLGAIFIEYLRFT